MSSSSPKSVSALTVGELIAGNRDAQKELNTYLASMQAFLARPVPGEMLHGQCSLTESERMNHGVKRGKGSSETPNQSQRTVPSGMSSQATPRSTSAPSNDADFEAFRQSLEIGAERLARELENYRRKASPAAFGTGSRHRNSSQQPAAEYKRYGGKGISITKVTKSSK